MLQAILGQDAVLRCEATQQGPTSTEVFLCCSSESYNSYKGSYKASSYSVRPSCQVQKNEQSLKVPSRMPELTVRYTQVPCASNVQICPCHQVKCT